MRRRHAIAARASRRRPPRVVTLSAPWKGLDERRAWTDMEPEQAIRLTNWYPGDGKVSVRKGSSVFATLTGVTGAVETLAELPLAAGNKLLAGADGELWDVTAGGTIASAETSSSFTSDRWQTACMSDLLLLVNGVSAPQQWDGTTVSAMTIDQASGEPALAVEDLIGVHVFKSRAYYWTGADQDFWYTAVNAHAGDLTLFPLGDVGTFGGVLTTMFTITRDGGSGPDDFAAFLMSSGDLIVYQGSDPGSADDWALVGVYRIGAPAGIRAWAKFGGDVLVITADGATLVSKAIGAPRGARGVQLDDRTLLSEVVREEAGNFGFEVMLYPRGRRLLLNYPEAGQFRQYAANLGTGAWCKFTGMDARCWALFNADPYFGGLAGKVYRADTGLSDAGADIIADARQAFSYPGGRSANKLIKMVRPVLETTGELEVQIGLAADFAPNPEATIVATVGTVATSGTKWDTAKWDTFKWGSSSAVAQGWLAHMARGYAISPSMRVEQSDAAISWNAMSMAYEPAGVI